MKRFLSIIFSRTFITAALILVQIAFIIVMILRFASYRAWTDDLLKILSLLMVLLLLRGDDNESYKLIWILTITLLPILGGLMYLFVGNRRPARSLRRTLDESIRNSRCHIKRREDIEQELPPRLRATSEYIARLGGFPLCGGSTVDYYKCGEDFFAAFLEEIGKAEKFIFLEYFIIAEGKAWDQAAEILLRKAEEGVDVRIIYDDMGSMTELPRMFRKKQYGKIKVIPFNPFIPVISVVMNHRDHRKITVIDGNTAFTGGINLADEYMNIKTCFGHWKDTAVKITGEGVVNFTVMFAQMWNAFSEDRIECDKCLPDIVTAAEESAGVYIQPFADSPLDNEQVSENVYLDILAQAERYVYIFTPYLIIDDQMKSALCLAAKRGVDVRIVTPGIPDKRAVFRITRSYYQTLIAAGVRIYEYTPGFIHAKSYISDDRIAVVGSINMDFRSLYLHFECGAMIAAASGCTAIEKLYADCMDTFSVSREIMPRESRHFSRSLYDAVLRALAPLV